MPTTHLLLPSLSESQQQVLRLIDQFNADEAVWRERQKLLQLKAILAHLAFRRPRKRRKKNLRPSAD